MGLGYLKEEDELDQKLLGLESDFCKSFFNFFI